MPVGEGQASETTTDKSVSTDYVIPALIVYHAVFSLVLTAVYLSPLVSLPLWLASTCAWVGNLMGMFYAPMMLVPLLGVSFEGHERQANLALTGKLLQFALCVLPIAACLVGGWGVIPWVLLFSLILVYFVVIVILNSLKWTVL